MAVKANLKWTDGLQFLARAGDSPAVVLDNHDGGGGPTPMEMVLMGAAGCTAMDVISILGVMYTFFGKGIKPEAVKQAIDLSLSKYCSATASLSAGVTYEFEIKAP